MPETVIVPLLLLVIPPALLKFELKVSLVAMVIAAELVMPLLAVMLPPVTAIVALLLFGNRTGQRAGATDLCIGTAVGDSIVGGAQGAARESNQAASAVADAASRVYVPSLARSRRS